MNLHQRRTSLATLPTFIALLASGCISYRTPGGRADFAVFADGDIKTILARKPASPLPVNLATVRVQEPRYWSRTARGYGHGRFSVVTVRDVEKAEDFSRIANLPDIRQVAPLNRLLLGGRFDSDRQLRRAAASLHADMLLVYTFDTGFYVGDSLRPLTVVTLGLSPNKGVRVSTTASAILVDVRTGYVYGSCEVTASKEGLASAWTSTDVVDRFRIKTERQAFESLLTEFEGLWEGVRSERKTPTPDQEP